MVERFSGEKLGNLVSQKGWKLSEFRRRLELETDRYHPSDSWLSRVISGKIESKPNAEYVSLFAKVLGCGIKDLFEEVKEKKDGTREQNSKR